MNAENYTALSDEELLIEAKKMKSSNLTSAVLIGCMIGIAIYSTVKNGFGFFTLFPLFFIFIVFKNGPPKKALEAEIKLRNLK
ncbi:hypothetical protein [Chryseobacterium sp. MP_3.2]|uniref:hypothetical protein n=1 Tax=Chryseobacterium sp. MP_3.2 TaxID=3071712 RepID=UPI002DFA36CB|nr:uncharacterized protein (DUF58 family) [Chryseobacterium sp. MP_3.2]